MEKNILNVYNEFNSQLSEFAYKNESTIKIIFINILIKWSILIEDLPWIWKTTLSKAISKLIWFDFNRIQGTSDLIPQDIIGWEFYNFNTKEIELRKGPIFTELLLVDEINRMNPKTQSAFLQAMEEHKVSIMGQDFDISDNFFVIATQNPIEYSWTFPLPEAQKDRFTSKISLWIPDDELQLEIILNNSHLLLQEKLKNIKSVINKEDLKIYNEHINNITISNNIWKRMVDFFNKIRSSDKIIYPLSQRWINTFLTWCRANAYINWRDYIIPSDGEEILESFLIHRLDIDKSENNLIYELYNKSFKNF